MRAGEAGEYDRKIFKHRLAAIYRGIPVTVYPLTDFYRLCERKSVAPRSRYRARGLGIE
jgi:hypothetical protein